MILQDVGKPFDNATLERVRHIDTTVRRSPSKHSPMPAAARMMEAVEESVRDGYYISLQMHILFYKNLQASTLVILCIDTNS